MVSNKPSGPKNCENGAKQPPSYCMSQMLVLMNATEKAKMLGALRGCSGVPGPPGSPDLQSPSSRQHGWSVRTHRAGERKRSPRGPTALAPHLLRGCVS